MKKLKLLFLCFSVTAISFAQESPRKQATGKIGNTNITVDYGSPKVKGRTIWGGLEKYNKVWRAGANENTTFSFDADVSINGTKVPKGKYGFFMIPKENGDWVIILSKTNNAWGAFSYKQSEDLLRLHLSPEFVNENQEELMFKIKDKGIKFAWEKVRIFIPVN